MRVTLWSILLLASYTSVQGAHTDWLRKLPLRFEPAPNAAHSQSEFVAHGANLRLRLAAAENWMDWTDATGRTASVHTSLLNANPGAQIVPEDASPGSVNYFVGRKENWRTGLPGFERMRTRDVYPGIDLVFHGNEGLIEYDFVISPNGDANRIRLRLAGQSDLRIDSEGSLVIRTAAGEIRWKRPEIYQEVDGHRVSVGGGFVLTGLDGVSFQISGYDKSRELIIDPVVGFASYLGQEDDDKAKGIAVDPAGNVYVTGVSSSIDLPTVSALQANFGGRAANPYSAGDGFVAKFNSAGKLIYLTYIGGSQDDGVSAIAVDAAGNAYITGATTSADFPVVNAYQGRLRGVGGFGSYLRTGDAFVAKIGPAGDKLLYSTYLGGSQDDIAFGISIDGSGNAYIAGATVSPDFPVTSGSAQTHFGGAGGEPIKPCCNGPEWDPGDAFIAKLDPTGSKLIFATYLGGSLDDVAFTIGLDSSNNIYIGGCTISYDFPTTAGALQRTFAGTDPQNSWQNFGDGFVAKLNSTGTAYAYSTYFGGPGDDCVSSIAVDSSGDVYMTGSTSSQNLKTSAGAFQPRYAGYSNLPFFQTEQLFGDAFAAKLNPAGSALLYFSYLGGSANDGGTAIVVDAFGDAYIAGFADSPDFPTAGSPLQAKFGGDRGFAWLRNYKPMGDAFLSIVNPSGTKLLYSSFWGGSADDSAGGLALDGQGNVYMAGGTDSSNMPLSAGAFQKTYGGGKADAFFAMFSGFGISGVSINKVANNASGTTTIAANTWVSIYGTGLAPAGDARTWANSDFVNGQMPAALDGVSVAMNGKNAFVYYISGSQLNVLTPPDLAAGSVQVVVTVGGTPSAPFTVPAAAYSTSLFEFGAGPYAAAEHGNGTYLGPTSLYPGSTTPAAPGEEIVLYGTGFGPTSVPIVSGSETQSGTLPSNPTVLIGGLPAKVEFAGLVFPGEYQFNVDVPTNAPDGDSAVEFQYQGQTTQSGVLITVHH